MNFGLEAVSLHGRFNGASRDSSCRAVAQVMAKFGSSCCTANEIRRDHVRFNASDMSAMHKRPRRRGKLVAARGTEIPRHVGTCFTILQDRMENETETEEADSPLLGYSSPSNLR